MPVYPSPFLYGIVQSLSDDHQERSQERVPGVPKSPLPLAKEPPLLFLTVILSQQERNELSISEILRFVCLQ